MSGSTATCREVANEVDIYVTASEIQQGYKGNATSCMKIASAVLEPAHCYSKTGVSSMTMFAGQRKQRPSSAHSLADYAALFDKYYGGDSRIERMVALSKDNTQTRQKARPATASAADRSQALRSAMAPIKAAAMAKARSEEEHRVDLEIKQRAVRETRSKYLTPYLASKYNVAVEGLTSRPALNPAVQGLTMVHTGSVPKDLALTASDMQGAAKVMELAATLQEAERQRAARVNAVRRRNSQRVTLSHRSSAPPRPASSSFKGPSRAQAQKASTRTGSGNLSGDLGPGKYNAGQYYTYMKKHTSTPLLNPKCHGKELAAVMAEGSRFPDPELGVHDHEQAAAGSPSSRESPLHTVGEGSSPQRQSQASKPDGPVMAIFKDAHRVHERKPPSEGSSSFKAPPRPTVDCTSTANHLALSYFQEGYDTCQVKAPKLIMHFEHQVPRQPLVIAADTPDALGPGAYLHRHNMPTSLTGRHVNAGHVHTRYALRFDGQISRPGSAPPTRLGQTAESTAEAAAALADMFGPTGADLNPSVLVSIRALEAAAESGPGGYSSVYYPTAAQPRPRRPASAAALTTAPDVNRDTAAVASNTHDGSCLGPEDLSRFSSTGLSKRVPGGRMSLTTRAEETMGLRIMSKDGVIPPATGPMKMGMGADVSYSPNEAAQGHRARAPAWKLPPNRYALSHGWVGSAAMAYT